MKALLIILYVLFSLNVVNAQPFINRTDSNHLKQGKWIGKYPDGTIRYEGFFNNGNPAGEWKRYDENSKLKAILVYHPNSDKIKAEFFDPEGSLVSKGNFIGAQKDSIWTYFDKEVIIGRENYSKGLKNGMSYTYFPDGKIVAETKWENGKLNGVWREYYSSGVKKSEINYLDGIRQGYSRIYYESGEIQTEGNYNNDQYAGTWNFYNPEGSLKFQLIYKDGILQNPQVADSLQLNEFKAFDKAKGKIKDPEHYRENPDEYLRK